jgi:hypothetical protein
MPEEPANVQRPTLEMRVAAIEDKLAALQITEQEMAAYQKVAALLAGGQVAAPAAAAPVAAAPALSPTVCVPCIRYPSCIRYPNCIRYICTCICNECTCGPCSACTPQFGAGFGSGFGAFGT